jgi:4-amino-4-deoxy-L-arabinose transferase-like glycosyltransferase
VNSLIPRNDGLSLLVLAAFLIGFKSWLTYAAGVELHFDEAQYWEWSKQLDWSYYSKGPLVAWLIALSERLFGHSEWAVRLPAWLAYDALLFLMYAFARDVWNSRAAAWWAVILLLFNPMYFTLSLVMTTDIFLFLFWVTGLWAAYRALILVQPRAWYVMGAAVGMGALTKLSIGLLPAGVGIAVLLTPRWRRHLASPHLWGGVLLMVIIMLPVILWNAGHDWVMLRHESGHMGETQWSLLRGLSFLGGQIFAFSPLIALVAIGVLRHPPANEGQRLLWGLSLGWLAFFFFKALAAKVQINWPAPCYISLLILFAGHIDALPRWQYRVVLAGFGLALAMMMIAYFPYQLGLTWKQDPFKRTKAWREPVVQLSRLSPPVDFILTPNYRIAAEMAFYWPKYLPTYVAGSAARRFDQHDLWPAIDREAGHNGLWVSTSTEFPPEMASAFDECIPLKPVPAVTPNGGTVRTLYASYCRNYRPIVWPKPSTY